MKIGHSLNCSDAETDCHLQEHVKRLTTVDMEVIQGSGAPTGEKHVVCWLPPETKNGERRSVYKEAVKIVVFEFLHCILLIFNHRIASAVSISSRLC